MLPGPVFNVELVTTARRRRYYAIRVGYGLILLAILWQNYGTMIGWDESQAGGEFSANRLPAFARTTFFTLMFAQGVAVLALTPAMVAGVIADERQRKTLHYLLASRLTGAEIVLGKLMARLLHVGVFLMIGVPIVAALTLFGGVDPDDVLRIAAGMATTAFFLAGLSILVSVVARRARDAILVTYLLELMWLLAPSLLAASLFGAFPEAYARIAPINDWLIASNPLTMVGPLGVGAIPPRDYGVARMCGVQASAGLLCVSLAVFRLRRGFRGQGAARLSKRRRWFARRPCGDDPMLWKECQASGFGGVTRVVARIAGVFVLLGLVYGTVILAPDSFGEVYAYGYGVTGTTAGRDAFNIFLRIAVANLYVFCAVGAAALAAGGVSGEKEEDTWTSLTATDLTGREILCAKMIGAVWGMWPLLAMMGVLGLLGVAAGAVHPFGLIALAVGTAAFLWFAAALGTFFSLHLKTTNKALTATIGALIFVNGGYLFCCLPFWRNSTPAVVSGCTPLVCGASLVSFYEVANVFKSPAERGMFDFTEVIVTISILGPILYAVMAAALTLQMIVGFDRTIDRTDRPVRARAVAKPPPPE